MGRRRLLAALEVAICSGLPTQLAIAGVLAMFAIAPFDVHGQLSATYVFALSLADAVLLLALVLWFLRLHGEPVRDVMFGSRRPLRETLLGLLLVPVLLLAVGALLLSIQRFAPWLHNVARNPFEGLIQSKTDAALFLVVAVIGGGVREEVQRAFILHRFEQSLGGGWFGLVVSSAAFGLGHLMQGRDVAITTAVLGAAWGALYLRRRSIVATVVNHSGFNAAEIFRYTLYGA